MLKVNSAFNNKYIVLFVVAVLNTIAMRFIPIYAYAFFIILILGAIITLTIILIDIIEKSKLWPFAVYSLFLGLVSLLAAIFLY
jgi:hypothetical protein